MATLGLLRYPLPASGAKTGDVYSADGELLATVDGVPGEAIRARCCVAVGEQMLLGILPANATGVAVCFAIPIAELAVAVDGSQGLFKKRPTRVRVTASDFRLDLSDVDKLLLSLEKYQTGRENDLVRALTG